ncbi:hypothetical protein F7Q95_18840 [Pseudomonas psychrophila]|nr:hypothetical protein F7Q95_18840 [Pseudomonas psychrophila]
MLCCELRGANFRSSCRGNEAAFGGVAVVKSMHAACQIPCGLRFYDRYAPERSLVPSATATRASISPMTVPASNNPSRSKPCGPCRIHG